MNTKRKSTVNEQLDDVRSTIDALSKSQMSLLKSQGNIKDRLNTLEESTKEDSLALNELTLYVQALLSRVHRLESKGNAE